MLEFKLFARRNKASMERMRELYKDLYDYIAHAFLSQIEGVTKGQIERMMVGAALLRGIPSAVILEEQFYPGLNSPVGRQMLGVLADVLLGDRDLEHQKKDNSA
jgi:hypothetical protein